MCTYMCVFVCVYGCSRFQVHVSMVAYVSDFECYCVRVFVCDDIGMPLCTCLCHRSLSDYVRGFE